MRTSHKYRSFRREVDELYNMYIHSPCLNNKICDKDILLTVFPSFSGHTSTMFVVVSCQISSQTSVLVDSSGAWAATYPRRFE